MSLSEAQERFQFGPFTLDLARGALFNNSSEVPLRPKSFAVLHYLAKKGGRLVSKEEVVEAVWPNVFVGDDALARCISDIRAALEDGDQRIIKTVPRRGYLLAAPVSGAAGAAAMPVGATTPECAVPEILVAAAPVPEAGVPDVAARGRGVGLVSATTWIEPRWRLICGLVMAGGLAALVGAAGIQSGIQWFVSDEATQPGRDEAAAPRLSIAVLTFHYLGDDDRYAYLAEAVTDDLTADLARIPKSTVISRASANAYRDRTIGARQIGDELGVRYLIEGSFHLAGDNLSINSQLIDSTKGAILWTEKFESSLSKLPNMQKTIIRHISLMLDSKIIQLEAARSLNERPEKPDALDLFIRARAIIDRDDTLAGLGKAQAHLERAIELEPDFLDAITTLTRLLLTKSGLDYPTYGEDIEAAGKLSERGIEPAPPDPRVHWQRRVECR
jgi:TolB-like protein/DNA-binding winged helix-turn-helix (wHTH) protein